MLSSDAARAKRDGMLRDGYAIIESVLPPDFLQALRDETERLIASHEEAPEHRFQGQHILARRSENALVRELLAWAPTYQALAAMGFGDFDPDWDGDDSARVVILTKEPGGPPLYWHQDWLWWNDPLSLAPWPQFMSLGYYLSDTSPENGCLKVIPGSHRKRFPLHDQLQPAHEGGARFIDEDDPYMFSEPPEQRLLPVKAGDLVLLDARALHAAGQNHTAERRTLVLSWHKRPSDSIPAFWRGPLPQALQERDPAASYERSRVPGRYLP